MLRFEAGSPLGGGGLAQSRCSTAMESGPARAKGGSARGKARRRRAAPPEPSLLEQSLEGAEEPWISRPLLGSQTQKADSFSSEALFCTL